MQTLKRMYTTHLRDGYLGNKLFGHYNLLNENKQDLKIILKNSLPLLICNLSQTFFPMISLFFCGHVGQEELDGVSLAFTVIDIFGLSFVYGIALAGDSIFPQIYGGPNKKLLGLYVQKSLIISILSSILVFGLLLNSRNLLVLIVKDQEVVKIAYEYVVVYMPSILFLNIANVLIKYMQAQNVIYPIMMINVVVLVINALLHYVFIDALDMGVRGAALAVDLSCFALMFLVILFILIKKLHVSTWPGWSMQCLCDWKCYLKLAIPSFAILLIEWSNMEIGTFLAGAINDVELGAMSICKQMLFILVQFPYSIATAGNIHIGQLLGSNKPEKAKSASKTVISISSLFLGIVCLMLYGLAKYIPFVFTDDSDTVYRARELLKLCALVHLMDGIQTTLAGVIRSLGGQIYGSIAIFVAFYVIGGPVGIALSLKTPMLIQGFLIGFMVGCCLLALAQIIYIFRADWTRVAQQAFDLNEINEILEEKGLPGIQALTSETSMANPIFLMEAMTHSETENPLEDGIVPGFEPKRKINMRGVIIKRLIVFAGVVVLFIVLFCLRNLNSSGPDSLLAGVVTTGSPLNTSNSTTVLLNTFKAFHLKHQFLFGGSLSKN